MRSGQADLVLSGAGPFHSAEAHLRCSDRVALPTLFLGTFLAVTILQRFAVPTVGSIIGIGFVLSFGLVIGGLFAGRLKLSLPRVCLYAVMASSMLITLFAKNGPFSQLSLMMLLTLYIPYMVTVELSALEWRALLSLFQRIMAFCGICGIVQFLAQLVVGSGWMFPFKRLLPSSLLIPGFNLQIPLGTGLSLFKSNGLWFLEPSIFSQFLAMAIIIELAYFRRPYYLMVFGVGYLTSFSGTGIMLLGVVSVFFTIARRQVLPILLLGVAAAFIYFLRDVPPFSLFAARVGEFANPQSSGSMRFLAPYWFIHDMLAGRPFVILFGYGPGSWKDLGVMLDYPVLDTGWLKLLAEYGLVGATAFFAFYGYALFHRSPDRLLSFACLIQFLFLGGYLNSFCVQFLHMALVAWPRLAPASAAGLEAPYGLSTASHGLAAAPAGGEFFPETGHEGSAP